MKFKVSNSEVGERIDLFLTKELPKFSRSQIQKAIDNGKILVDGRGIKSSYKVRYGNTIFVDKNYIENLGKPPELLAEKIPLEILHENKDLLVINKPAGLVVHPAAGNWSGTLVNAILNYDPKILNAIGEKSRMSQLRPGIIHRLDKDTTGVIIIAKNKTVLSSLSKQLRTREVKKKYEALVYGWPPESETIKSYLSRDKKNRKIVVEVEKDEGKEAISNYKVEKYLTSVNGKNHVSLLEIEIPTGRTHQIRVQFLGIGYPVVGDPIYNTKESKKLSMILGAKRQMLHAASIEFALPGKNKLVAISAPLPKDFRDILDKLKEIS